MKYKDDPYQVDYALIQDIEILREGNWNWSEYDGEFLNDMALIYDPELLRAKLIKDHDYWGPAFGHILALHTEDDASANGVNRLIATIGFLQEGKEMVESGQYNERSVGFASFHPTPGFAYLWETSLLGANTPAAVGMAPIIFDKEETDKMTKQLEIDRLDAGQSPDAVAKRFTWEKDEEYIHHRVRNKSRFKGALRTVEFDEKDGILAKVGKLKPEYVPEDEDGDSLVVQAVMFVLEKGWTLTKAMAWIGQRTLSTMSVTIASVVPFQDLPLADEELEWDNDAAEKRRREYAGGEDNIDWDKYRKAYLWYDSENKEAFGGYKLPIADIIDDSLEAVPRGVFAAAGAIGGARGGVDIPENDVDGVKAHLEKYYDKMDREAPWQEEANKDSQQGIEGITESVTLANEGGKPAMADVQDEKTDKPEKNSIVVVEAGSTQDLGKRNIELRELKERHETEAQERLRKENEELREKADLARYESVKSEVRTMHAEGYITAQQVDMGLADALACIPDDAAVLVGDRKRTAREVIADALRYGGKLKLKLEIAKDILSDDPTDTLAKARAKGYDTSVEERRIQLMKDNPEMPHSEALDRATREVRT